MARKNSTTNPAIPRIHAWSDSRPAAKIAPKISASTAAAANASSVWSTALARSLWTCEYCSHSHLRAVNCPLS